MPLFGYTAVAALHGKLFASAAPLDPDGAWDPATHNTPDIPELVQRRIDAEPANRLLAHHGHCATVYGCYTAQNLFYRRNEMAIAVSVACNAQCVGCISEQLDDVTAPHDRIAFTPTVDEIASLAVPHLESAPNPIVSFGQGCEGEPLLRARLIGRVIAETRRRTNRGQLHINTNGSSPRAVRHLIDAGLDSIRVSMFSAREANHVAYYGPRNYGLGEMEECLRLARRQGLHTSVNLLIYPGFNDCPSEAGALIDFFRRSEVQMVQMRALSMDRELLEEKVGFPRQGDQRDVARDSVPASPRSEERTEGRQTDAPLGDMMVEEGGDGAPTPSRERSPALRERGIGVDMFMDMVRAEIAGIELGSHTPFVGRARAYVS
jgi:molybdenum cofactor biosynthesis enzyme MoaA